MSFPQERELSQLTTPLVLLSSVWLLTTYLWLFWYWFYPESKIQKLNSNNYPYPDTSLTPSTNTFGIGYSPAGNKIRTNFLERFLVQTAFGCIGDILKGLLFHAISAFLQPVKARKCRDYIYVCVCMYVYVVCIYI